MTAPILDAWVNWDLERLFETFPRDVMVGVIKSFDQERERPALTESDLLASMERAGVDRALLTGRLWSDVVPETARRHPERFRAAMTVDDVSSIGATCRRIEELVDDPIVAMIRVLALVMQEPINSRVFYPIYERCEGLGIPLSINVGIPGPRVRGACQQPLLLEDILIDFPDLVVVGAHMGHPWEDVLIRFMMKFENLYLSNSAFLATYMDPALVRFMNSSRGRDRLIFASDWPLLSMTRAAEEARKLPLDDLAMESFLGGNASRVLRWD